MLLSVTHECSYHAGAHGAGRSLEAWQTGALLTSRDGVVVSLRCLPVAEGGIDLCVVAATNNTVGTYWCGRGGCMVG